MEYILSNEFTKIGIDTLLRIYNKNFGILNKAPHKNKIKDTRSLKNSQVNQIGQ